MTVLEQVKNVCFNANIENRDGLHCNVLHGLKALFAKGGYKVYLEYPIHFKSRIRKSGDWIFRDGNLDLVAIKEGRKIAIEFDTGVRLKFTSIEKLFQVDADLCIGIIKGRSNRSGSLDVNIERFEKLTKEVGNLKKNVWLIVLSEKIIHEV
ncbi:MAG: hypothetical protein AMJ75_07400 [Phycisphaerae bacterium SM1_79]|nr:MAG: hypothetical protein AMJ75_07400 [Phycisphaerae bacterium SM1_79]